MPLDFAGGRLSSAAGLVLRTDPAEQRGFTRALAAVRSAPGAPRRVPFPLHALRTQRVWHLAAGAAEAHEAQTLRHDPLCTRLLERLPATGAPWAAHPTLARFAHRGSRPGLSRLARGFLEPWSASSARPPQRRGLDFDDPEDPVQGAPEQARYEASSGGAGFLPLPLEEGRAGRLLTPSCKAKRGTGAQRLAVLKRGSTRLRPAWPAPLLRWRGDRPWAYPEVRQWIEAQPPCSEGTALPSQALLQARARAVGAQAQRAYARAGRTRPRCHSPRSQAGTWAPARRGVLKGAGRAHGVPPRGVVPALEQARPQGLSQPIDGARGQADKESKAHPRSRHAERPSCQRFAANPWRWCVPAAASG
jgi:hypothetical protein